MALHQFLNDLILSQQKKDQTMTSFSSPHRPSSMNILVIEDNARPIWSRKHHPMGKSSSAIPTRHRSLPPESSSIKKNTRWGLSHQQQGIRDPYCLIDSPTSVVMVTPKSSSSDQQQQQQQHQARPTTRRMDTSLVVPQRVASPSSLQTVRKRVRKGKEPSSFDDSCTIRPITVLSSSSSITTLIPPLLPTRFKSPSVVQDPLHKKQLPSIHKGAATTTATATTTTTTTATTTTTKNSSSSSSTRRRSRKTTTQLTAATLLQLPASSSQAFSKNNNQARKVGNTLAILDKAQAIILDGRHDDYEKDNNNNNKGSFSEMSTMINEAIQRHRVVGRYTKDSRITVAPY
jgi:hypothetical protein